MSSFWSFLTPDTARKLSLSKMNFFRHSPSDLIWKFIKFIGACQAKKTQTNQETPKFEGTRKKVHFLTNLICLDEESHLTQDHISWIFSFCLPYCFISFHYVVWDETINILDLRLFQKCQTGRSLLFHLKCIPLINS